MLRRHVAATVVPLTGLAAWRGNEESLPDFSGTRVAFACRHLRFSGSVRVLIEQAAALQPTGAQAMILCFEDGADPAVVDELRQRAPCVKAIIRGDRKLRAVRTIWRTAGPFRPHYWIGTDTPDPLILADKLARLCWLPVPRIAMVVHEAYDRYLQRLVPWRRRLDAVLLSYDFGARAAEMLGGSTPMTILAPLFPLSASGASPERNRERRRAEMRIPQEAQVLGYAGRLGPNKRIEEMIGLLAELIREGREDVWLLLAGEWELPEYRRKIESRLEVRVQSRGGGVLSLWERVRLIGPLRDLSEAYEAMDIFLLLSQAEGFYPLSVLEAQLVGRPVVCMPAGGLSRVILDGVTGELLPGLETSRGVEWTEESRTAALMRIRRLLDCPDKAAAIGAAGRQVAEWLTTHYSFGPIFRGWLAERLRGGRER